VLHRCDPHQAVLHGPVITRLFEVELTTDIELPNQISRNLVHLKMHFSQHLENADTPPGSVKSSISTRYYR
jgi:hypothetical protein